MGTTERKQRQKEEVYDSILRAAWRLVMDEGWQGLSIRKIAEAIEYSIPVIYDHFENKEAILAEFTRKGFRELNETLRRAAAKAEEGPDQLRVVALTYWNFAMENKEYYQLMYGMGMPTCETVNSMKELQELTGILGSTVVSVTGGTEIPFTEKPSGDSFVKMKSFWSMLHGLVSIQMMANEPPDTPSNMEVFNESVQNFIAGLKNQ